MRASRVWGTPSPRQFEYVSASRASHEAMLFTNDIAEPISQLGSDVSKTAAFEMARAPLIGQGIEMGMS
jgi:hypothetical protein